MLKALFAGGGLAGFVVAAVLGLGFNPVSAGGHTSTAKSNVSKPAKAELGTDKSLINEATDAAAAILDVPTTAAATPAIDASAIANSLSSLTGSDPAPAATTATSSSSDDMSGLLNGIGGGDLSSLTSGAGDLSSLTSSTGDLSSLTSVLNGSTNNKSHGKNTKKSNSSSDLNINDLTNLIGGGR